MDPNFHFHFKNPVVWLCFKTGEWSPNPYNSQFMIHVNAILSSGPVCPKWPLAYTFWT